jgi:hypothetical protein
MSHPLVDQLRFTRSEFMRGIKGLGEDEALRRFIPMNCISWNVGHLAWQEQRYFLTYGQGVVLYPEIKKNFAYGAPASEPRLKGVLEQRETDGLHVWESAPTRNLSLLVPPRREYVYPPDAGADALAPVRGFYRRPGALSTGII